MGAKVEVGKTLTIASAVHSGQIKPLNGGSPYFEVGSLIIETNATFSALGLGFLSGFAGKPAGNGPGGGDGAGYGGAGYRGVAYGSRERPEYAGSGGNGSGFGAGGNGGGLIRVVAERLVVVEGEINASSSRYINGRYGYNNHISGGAGGAIFIECAKFYGTPAAVLSAKGSQGRGSQTNGGGGGGRIANLDRSALFEGIRANRVLSSRPAHYRVFLMFWRSKSDC